MKATKMENLVRILNEAGDSRTVFVIEAPPVPHLLDVHTDEGYEDARRKESERQRKKMLKYQR